jgi:zinc protease
VRRRVACCTLLALTLAAASASAQVPNWPSERPPRPLPARDVKFPPYRIATLENGLQVIAVSHHEQPAVSLRLLVRAGGAQDPAEKPGVATLAAAVLDQGTTTRSAEQIASTIDSVGGAMGAAAATEFTWVNAVVMKDSFNLALDLVSDIARNPSFAAQEIERQRQQMLSALKVSYDDPDYLAGMVFDRLVYGFHPYGRPNSGTPESLSAITRDDLVTFHRKWFGANNAILAVVGDISAEEAFAGAERAFGKWGKADSTAARPVDPPPPTRRVVVIDRPGAVQTEIRVGHAALPRKHADYLALDLAIKILGGEGGNRLHRVLRSERGLTYGASADTNALKEAGHIVADTDTRSESTGEALRLIVEEMWRLQRQPVHPRELEDAKAYLTGSFPLTIETPSAIALQVLNAVFFGLDLQELQTYRERVNAVTVEDIQRVAKQYLRPDRLSIVLVGDASSFAKQLAGVGFEEFERIPVAELDLSSADLRRRTAAGAAGYTPVALRRGAPAAAKQDLAALIERAIVAKGGLEKLQSIQTVKVESVVTIRTMPNGPVEVPTTTAIRYPGGFRIDATTPMGQLVQAFNAGQYWVQDSRGVREAPAGVAAEILSNVQRDVVPMLLALAEGRITATRLDDLNEQGRKLPAIEVKAAGMRPVTVVLDPETALIRRQQYVMSAGPGSAKMEEIFSDYRAVDGLQVAFKAEVRRNGTPILDRVVRSVQLNPPLAATLFTKPS